MFLDQVKGKWSEDLIVILNTDKKLIESIKSGRAPRSVVEFENYYATLSRSNGAKVFSIVDGDHAIGLGMLAYRDVVANSARLSFWIGTKYQNEKTLNDVFTLLVDEAIRMDLAAIFDVMRDQDSELLSVWERYGAERRDVTADGRVYMTIHLK